MTAKIVEREAQLAELTPEERSRAVAQMMEQMVNATTSGTADLAGVTKPCCANPAEHAGHACDAAGSSAAGEPSSKSDGQTSSTNTNMTPEEQMQFFQSLRHN